MCVYYTTLQRYYNLQTWRQQHYEQYVYIVKILNIIKDLTLKNSNIKSPQSSVVNIIRFVLIVLFFAFLALGRSELGECVRHLSLYKC